VVVVVVVVSLAGVPCAAGLFVVVVVARFAEDVRPAAAPVCVEVFLFCAKL
jgi:hypothetical protein